MMSDTEASPVSSPRPATILEHYSKCLPKNCGPQRDISREALLDDRVSLYWQSDGPQPHAITIEFQKYTEISFLLMYLDCKSDESYTPQKVQVYTGLSILDLEEPPKVVNFQEPVGWQVIDLRRDNDEFVRAFVVQVQILQNHQNGRDTHVRGCKVLGPMYNDLTTRETVPMHTKELKSSIVEDMILMDRLIR